VVNLKRIITFVLVAALILAAFTVLSLPSVKADASEARVVDYSWYIAPSSGILAENAGDLVVVGEIQNVGTHIIQNATVSGTALSNFGSISR
jgi:hypothetical protein